MFGFCVGKFNIKINGVVSPILGIKLVFELELIELKNIKSKAAGRYVIQRECIVFQRKQFKRSSTNKWFIPIQTSHSRSWKIELTRALVTRQLITVQTQEPQRASVDSRPIHVQTKVFNIEPQRRPINTQSNASPEKSWNPSKSSHARLTHSRMEAWINVFCISTSA